jgi:hypothetical protein
MSWGIWTARNDQVFSNIEILLFKLEKEIHQGILSRLDLV